MSAFLMVSNPELREEDKHLSVYTIRLPELVSPICYKTTCFDFSGGVDLSKNYLNIVQNAMKSLRNKAEFPYMP